jgi:hypothetical protein
MRKSMRKEKLKRNIINIFEILFGRRERNKKEKNVFNCEMDKNIFILYV